MSGAISKNSRGIKKAKKKKDPNAPKRPRSAYIIFCTQQRASVKAENPDDKPSEIMRKLGEKWKEMEEDEKRQYTDEAAGDKDRYKDEMNNYHPPDAGSDDESEEEDRPKKKKGKKTKDPNAPKKAMSAYLFFGQDMRPKIKSEFPDMKSAEIMKKIGEEWKKLTDDQKKKFEELAKADKNRYTKEMGKTDAPKKDKKPKKPASDEEEEEDDDGDDDDGGDDDDDDDAGNGKAAAGGDDDDHDVQDADEDDEDDDDDDDDD